jgi:formate dehydrogenase
MVRVCDVVTINAPLHPETKHLFNDALIGKMKRGAYLVNTVRGKICDRDAAVRALNSAKGDPWVVAAGTRHRLRSLLAARA